MAQDSAAGPPYGPLRAVRDASLEVHPPSRDPSPRRTRSTGKDTQDVQAQVDRIERARDIADSDYGDTGDRVEVDGFAERAEVDFIEAEPPAARRKRRVTFQVSPNTVKKRCSRHQAYASLRDPYCKRERDKLLQQIYENWGDDTQWMPEFCWPCNSVRKDGNPKAWEPIIDPLNWNTPILHELCALSERTKGRPNDARKALANAVKRRQRREKSYGETQVLKEDVQAAMKKFKAPEPTASAPDSAMDDGEAATIHGQPQSDRNVPPTETHDGLLRARSVTFALDKAAIKLESDLSGTIDAPLESAGGWTSYQDEVDKLNEARLEAEEHEAIAVAKRAQHKQIAQRRRLQELMKQHGRSREDAIVLGGDGHRF